MCVLTDFGISAMIDDKLLTVNAFKISELRAMSVKYAAPERILSFKKNIPIKTTAMILSHDTYANGIIMYELLNKVKLYSSF